MLFDEDSHSCVCPASKPHYNGNTCVNCPEPSFWQQGSLACVTCPLGSYHDASTNQCLYCPDEAPIWKEGQCISCPSGTVFNRDDWTCVSATVGIDPCPTHTHFDKSSRKCICDEKDDSTVVYDEEEKVCQYCPIGTLYRT